LGEEFSELFAAMVDDEAIASSDIIKG